MSSELFLRLFGDGDESGVEKTVPEDGNEYHWSAGPEIIQGLHFPGHLTLEERWNAWMDEINR